MLEPELVREPGGGAEDYRSVAGGLQYRTAAPQPGVSNPSGIRGGNRRGKRLWKRHYLSHADGHLGLPNRTLTPIIGPYTFIPKSSTFGWDKKAFDTCR